MLTLFVTAVLATLVLYFWARKALLEKQLLQEREENERIMSVAEDLQKRLGKLQEERKGGTGALVGTDMLDRLLTDRDLLIHYCDRIDRMHQSGCYDGAYNCVKLATEQLQI